MCEQGIRHLRTRPYTPRTNGKVERFIQTAVREWAYAQPYASSRMRIAAMRTWLPYNNCQRPHIGIAERTPRQGLLGLVNNVIVNNIQAVAPNMRIEAVPGRAQHPVEQRLAGSLTTAWACPRAPSVKRSEMLW